MVGEGRESPLSPISFIFLRFSAKSVPNNRLLPRYKVAPTSSSPGNHGSTKKTDCTLAEMLGKDDASQLITQLYLM